MFGRLRAELQGDKKDKNWAKKKTALKKVVSVVTGMLAAERVGVSCLLHGTELTAEPPLSRPR